MANATDKPEEATREFLPESLLKTLRKLPTAEALQILQDLGKSAWVVDNNNNNKAAVFDDLILQKVAKLPAEELRRILEHEAE